MWALTGHALETISKMWWRNQSTLTAFGSLVKCHHFMWSVQQWLNNYGVWVVWSSTSEYIIVIYKLNFPMFCSEFTVKNLKLMVNSSTRRWGKCQIGTLNEPDWKLRLKWCTTKKQINKAKSDTSCSRSMRVIYLNRAIFRTQTKIPENPILLPARDLLIFNGVDGLFHSAMTNELKIGPFGFGAIVGAIDSNLHKPQSDKGSMSRGTRTFQLNNPSAPVISPCNYG